MATNPFALSANFGNTIRLAVSCTRLDGTAANLTGATLWATFKYNLTDPDTAAVVQKTTANGGIVVTNATTGQAQITLTPSDIPAPTGQALSMVLQADVKIREANGDEWTLAQGTISLTQAATRTI